MILAAALMALPALAQNFGSQPADQPNASFQSTSTMTGSGSQYSANPTLNSDGTASYNGETSSPSKGPNKAKKWDSGELPDKPNDGPIGDALLPLLLMSLAFGMFVYFRRKQTLNS